ncbi:uncharacterized protein LOC142174630 [Nicotiana tabacum]|uniref:Uncharacterized protein LOC142174630 n=1 Tax=Nicotiana tabacum TaxID=4097 RepID=A0AC58TH70_TOBAC
MIIKLVVGEFTLNVVSAYASQVGLDEEIKRHFWENLDEVVLGVPHTETFHRMRFQWPHWGDFGGYDNVHGDFAFGIRNGGGTSLLDSLLDFAKAFDLVITNLSYQVGEL